LVDDSATADRAVGGNEGVVIAATKALHICATFHVAHAVILWRVHAPIGEPGGRVERHAGQLIVDGVQHRGEELSCFLQA
jgi:hypothetical protein